MKRPVGGERGSWVRLLQEDLVNPIFLSRMQSVAEEGRGSPRIVSDDQYMH